MNRQHLIYDPQATPTAAKSNSHNNLTVKLTDASRDARVTN